MDVVGEFVRVLKLEANAILSLEAKVLGAKISADEISGAVALLQRAVESRGKIIVTGVGKSGKIAQKIASTLASTGSLAVYLHPTDGLHGDLGMVDSKDVILALSQTGATSELIRLLPSFQSLAVPIIGIGGQRDSPLGRASRFWVDTSVEQEACPLGLAPTTSSTLALAVGDALAVALMRARGIDVETFARNHPGGSLGWKTRKVQEVMKKEDEIAWVGPSDSMDRVLQVSGEKRLGAVLVAENPNAIPRRLAGIITEGDIRRALVRRDVFFDLKASEIMNPKPVTVAPEQALPEALALMENRPHQISVLAVVDPRTLSVLGLVRLHDLVRETL